LHKYSARCYEGEKLSVVDAYVIFIKLIRRERE